ncbi:MAG: hypothetical protein ACLP22_14750 [Solirubrobacteraceae bacterium]
MLVKAARPQHLVGVAGGLDRGVDALHDQLVGSLAVLPRRGFGIEI